MCVETLNFLLLVVQIRRSLHLCHNSASLSSDKFILNVTNESNISSEPITVTTKDFVIENLKTVIYALVIAVLIRLIANLLSDLALAAVDPRIRFK